MNSNSKGTLSIAALYQSISAWEFANCMDIMKAFMISVQSVATVFPVLAIPFFRSRVSILYS